MLKAAGEKQKLRKQKAEMRQEGGKIAGLVIRSGRRRIIGSITHYEKRNHHRSHVSYHCNGRLQQRAVE
jgi:hypothetical protein